ncbi:VOC family protein [Candidatus Poribacteria bacterium]|nr:VOC family protein [Candidatus Poribacteria bacterium]
MLTDQLNCTSGLPGRGIAAGRLGLTGLEAFRYYVHNPARSRQFYLDRLGFKQVARSTPDLEKIEGASTTVYGAGRSRVEVSCPSEPNTWSARFLELHPDGISNLIFGVKDIEYAWRFLAERGAAFIDVEPHSAHADGGTFRGFSIATPLGDVVFTFVERGAGYDNYAPGFERTGDLMPQTEFNYRFVDHVTSNTRTMMPVIWFYKHIMGFEEYWSVEFHTNDVCQDWHRSSGLRSIVMWDPDSGIKFATNEPKAPAFWNSQVSRYCDDNFGPGVQHVALAVPEICDVVQELYGRKVLFLDAPDAYYNDLPERMKIKRILNLDKPIERLKELGILLDGEENHYLLQIFLKDSQTAYQEKRAGPFFYELIQRAGHKGFGEGNFRALFEAIAKEQRGEAPVGDGGSNPYAIAAAVKESDRKPKM